MKNEPMPMIHYSLANKQSLFSKLTRELIYKILSSTTYGRNFTAAEPKVAIKSAIFVSNQLHIYKANKNKILQFYYVCNLPSYPILLRELVLFYICKNPNLPQLCQQESIECWQAKI
jgi:hypothetical protein